MRRMQELPLERKLALVVLVTSTLSLIVTCIAIVGYETTTFRDRVVKRLSATAQLIGANSSAALTFHDPKTAREYLDTLAAQPDIYSAAIYSNDGTLFAQFVRQAGSVQSVPSEPESDGYRFDGKKLFLTQPIQLGNERLGTIFLESVLESWQSRLGRYAGIVGIVLLALGIAMLALEAALQRLISKPLHDLVRVAQGVTQDKNYSIRVVKRSEDEIGQLTDALNQMLVAIEERNRALQAAHDQLEQRVRERTEELRANEERHRLVTENAYDAFIAINAGGIIAEWNYQAEQTFGWKRDEAIGRSLAEMIIPPALREKHQRGMAHFLATGEGPALNTRLELTALRRDGREFPVELTITPVRIGRDWVFNAFLHDITERKQAEEELQRLNRDLVRQAAALAASNKELEAFSYSVSHDLRAPLRGIDGLSLALLEDYADRLDAPGQDYLNRVRAAAQRMDQLIAAMLTLSRVTRSEIRPVKVDLSAIANEIALQFRREQPDRHVEFMIQDGLLANGDLVLLRQVLENLLANAWKFTAKHPSARIQVGAIDQNGTRTFFVRDDGVGFDMTYAEKLFHPFQRMHSLAEFAGSGIGLATVQRIINRHGGRIWVEAGLGKGATFFFTVP